jgi:hypothetical protein
MESLKSYKKEYLESHRNNVENVAHDESLRKDFMDGLPAFVARVTKDFVTTLKKAELDKYQNGIVHKECIQFKFETKIVAGKVVGNKAEIDLNKIQILEDDSPIEKWLKKLILHDVELISNLTYPTRHGGGIVEYLNEGLFGTRNLEVLKLINQELQNVFETNEYTDLNASSGWGEYHITLTLTI